ncbi:interferon-induced GTP-binding protein Mx1 [Nannizzia gypsea CBS 118893]|uniref:Interferon-induced GTP-binding protein Mx1 n=1 Tax=Arthroderma gypseum (strain ATCC MYA-4604 / CBS 118893) TaxID=535722 RepID=E5R0W9_ARTGP|nr:interferon-induced GTP-binding protein Mx1 [Nannizzia gypsea CBS 118893]EFQ98411.1 interferon-induced GTP-binding protein Mx1 [Nannizzia gypsea CBS 118893]
MAPEPHSSPSTVGTEEKNDSIGFISQNMREMVKKIQDLRHLGIENHGLPLPKIVVVGDQSVGKSSLIEGMSEIKVPRSAGCCTRCPLEINLSESDDPWTCRLILTKKYMFDATGRSQRATNARPLGPWIEQDPEELHFATLTDKNLLQEHLKWAQLAILNPGRSHTDFIPGEDQEIDGTYSQVKFSPNVVRLDISAPGFPNLSFYDLPGVINVAELDEERYLVGLVENLVKEYIKAQNCIILLALPMTDDATNSSAARIIRDIPGARDRTVGVLTKPDRVELKNGNEYDQWREILRGEKFATGHGYFVVQNNPDPRIDHATARIDEGCFFSNPPWTTELAEYSDRFGTRRLQTALSKLLLRLIQDSLPKIIEQINTQAEFVDQELAKLPNPPSANVSYILCQKLNAFVNNVQMHVDGGSAKYPFLKQWGILASEFQQYLSASRPGLSISCASESANPESKGDDSTSSSKAHKRKNPPQTNGTSDLKKKKVGDIANGSTPNVSAFNVHGHFDNFHISKEPRTFTLSEIRDINADTYASGVPGLGNPHAVEALNRISVSHWEEPMEKFLLVTYALMKEVLLDEMRSVFGQYEQTALFDELKVIIVDFLESIRIEHFNQAESVFNIECLKPFTMANALFQRGQAEAHEYFFIRRYEARARQYIKLINAQQEASGNKPSKMDPNKVSEKDLGPDEFAKELDIMSASRAYYNIASSRFVDTTCQGIHIKLFMRCRDELRGEIEQKLGILDENASERCIELMAEDRERQVRRMHLQKEKDKLDKAQGWLKVAEKSPEPLFCDANSVLP